jgi:hypothetical protein
MDFAPPLRPIGIAVLTVIAILLSSSLSVRSSRGFDRRLIDGVSAARRNGAPRRADASPHRVLLGPIHRKLLTRTRDEAIG